MVTRFAPAAGCTRSLATAAMRNLDLKAAIRAERILVVDLEAACYNNAVEDAAYDNEIIEIGVCMLHVPSGRILDRESIIVRLRRSPISAFCTELTSITQKMVDEGFDFTPACDILRERFESDAIPWASDGNFDRQKFAGQCLAFGVDYPFGAAHLNIKSTIRSCPQLAAMGAVQKLGIPGYMKLLGLEFDGRLHRGIDDALNAARALARLSRRYGGGRLPASGWHFPPPEKVPRHRPMSI